MVLFTGMNLRHPVPDQTSHQAIGILGGTFDPIHFGHLRMALEIYDILGLAKVHLIPTYQSLYRKGPVASPSERFAMVQCAVADEPALIADDREIRRKDISYTIDTLIEMRTEMPDVPFCLLLGIDAFLGLPTWHRFEEILDHAHLIVAHRPHYHLPDTGPLAELVHAHLQKDFSFVHQHQGGGVLLCPIAALEISATNIRKQIALGKNPRYLLPDKVYDYIKEHRTYSHR